jgi:hypothetical protein
MNDACGYEPISFIHNRRETEIFTANMKRKNDNPKNMQLRLIAPNKKFVAPNEKKIPLVATTHRDQWNFCRAQQNFRREAYAASSHGRTEIFYTTRRAVAWYARKILYHGIIHTKDGGVNLLLIQQALRCAPIFV